MNIRSPKAGLGEDVAVLAVGLVLNSLAVGGAEWHVVRLCSAVTRSRVALRLFVLLRDEDQRLRSAVPSHTPVKVSPYGRHDPRVLSWLARCLQSEPLDVVHSFLWYADFVTALSKAVFRWPQALICSERGERGESLYRTAQRVLDRAVTFRMADGVCANSEFGRRMVERAGVRPAKVHVIPNGVDVARADAAPEVDLRAMLGWPRSADLVGVVCRLVWYKGVDTVLRAVARLAPQRDVRCVIIGDGPARRDLEDLVVTLGLEGRVAFLGMQAPAESFIKGFDVAVLATRTTESCSNAILEYMACARPVVATRVAGNGELVIDGETGHLIEPDDHEALAGHLATLLTYRDIARRLGARGRGRVEAVFQMAPVGERFVDLWASVRGETGTP